jgi:hypothetical protein
MRHWRAFLVAAAIGAAIMGGQPLVFGEPGAALGMAGIGALTGLCVILFALGSEGLLFDDRPQPRGYHQPKSDPGPPPASLVRDPEMPPARAQWSPPKPPRPDAVAGGYIGDLPGVNPEWLPPPEDE